MHTAPARHAAWPTHLPVAAVRVARPSDHLEECCRFYEDVVGLVSLTEFHDHEGYDGVVLGLPDHSVQLELVRRHGVPAPAPNEEDALVLYLDDGGAALRRRLGDTVELLRPANPYWSHVGAFAFADPDGRLVIASPSSAFFAPDDVDVRIEPFAGDRRELLWSFRLAEDSAAALEGYLADGRVWVALIDDEVVGHVQAVARDDGTWEILNTAVAEPWRGRGIGRVLLERCVLEARLAGATRLAVATAAADIGNLRFYQRCGLRMSRVVRDRFVAATGYPDRIDVDGIELRDQVWFDRAL